MKNRLLATSIVFLLAFAHGVLAQEDGASPQSSAIDIPEEFEGVMSIMDFERQMDSDGDFEFSDSDRAEKVYSNFLNSSKQIRLLETASDVFTAVQKPEGGRELVSFANGKIQRRFYDSDLRLDKIEYWRLNGSSADSSLERVVTYNPPNASGLYSIFERNFADSTETRSFFHSNQKLKSRRKNYFDKDGALASFDIFVCLYDSAWRTKQERLQKYSVNKKSVALLSDELSVSKYSGDILQETSYYKNSILRVRTFFLDGKTDEFARATYFDGGIIVRDFYKGNVKISSTIDKGAGDER